MAPAYQALARKTDVTDDSTPPLALHDIVREAERQLDAATLSLPLSFRVGWQDLAVSVSVNASGASRAEIRLSAMLGLLPFSVENRDGRRQTFERLAAFRRRGIDSIELDSAGRVHFDSATLVAKPASLLALVEQLALVMLALDANIGEMREHLLIPKTSG